MTEEEKKDPADFQVTPDVEPKRLDLSKYDKDLARINQQNYARDQIEKSILQNTSQSLQAAKNPYGKLQSYGLNYGTSNRGGVNLERYYNRDEFQRLGFTPFGDNESYYQANTTFWDDFRAARQGFSSLFGIGLWSYFSPENDYTKADRYARAANIGTSQREGTASRMFNNAVLNSGYTIGLMTGILLEEVPLYFLTGGVGNLAKMGKTSYKIGQSVKAFDQAKHLRDLTQAFDVLKDANKARDFWKTSRNVGKASLEALVPGYTTIDMLANWKKIGQVGKTGITAPLETGAKMQKLFGSFYRDTREILLVHDESKLEASMIYNDLMDEMILDYQNTYGRLPDEYDLVNLDKVAKEQERRTYIKNMGIIYLTNRISFGNAFNRMNPKLIRPGTKAIYQNKAGVIKADLSNNSARAVFKEGFLNVKGATKEAFRTVKNIKHTYKPMLKGLGRGAVKYTRANFGEGLQEYFQETIQEAEKITGLDLYDRYKQGLRGAALDDALSSTSFFENYGQAASHFWSAEGAEIFGIGFMMGGIAGPYMGAVSRVPNMLSQLSEYRTAESRQKRANDLKEARLSLEKKVEQFNKLTSREQEHIYNYILQVGRQAAYRQQMDDAEEEGNDKKFYDVKNEALGNYILNALSTDTFDLFINSLEDMMNMSDEEFAEGFKDQLGFEDVQELKGLKQRASEIIQSAKNIKTLYEEVNNFFPEFADFTEGELEQYGDLSLGNIKTIRDNYIKMMVLNQHQLEQNLVRINKLFQSLTAENNPFRDVKNIELSSVSSLLSPELMQQEIDRLQNEEITLKEIITSDKEFNTPTKTKEKELKTIQNKLKRLTEINNTIKNFVTRTKYLNILEQQQKILKSQNPKLMVGQKVTVNIKGQTDSKVATVLNATLKDDKVILEVEYLPEGETKKVTTSIEVNPNTIEELNIDASTDLLKISEEADNALRTYLFQIAKENNTTIDFSKMDKFIKAYTDAKILKAEEQDLSEQILMMTSPGVFYDFMKKGLERRKKMNKFIKSSVKRDLKAYYEAAVKNALVQRLVEQHQAFLKADDLAEILELGKQATYKVFDVNNLEEILPGTKKHSEVNASIIEFIEDIENAEEVAKEQEEKIETPETDQEEDISEDEQEQYVELDINKVKNTPLEELPKTFIDILKDLIDARAQELEAQSLENTITIDTVQTDPLAMQLIANAIAEYKKQEGTIKPDNVKKSEVDLEQEQEEEQKEVEIEYESEFKPEDIKSLITLLLITPSKELVDFNTLTGLPEILKPDPAYFYKKVLVSGGTLTQISPNIKLNESYLLHNQQKTQVIHVSATPTMQSDVVANPTGYGYSNQPQGLNTFEAVVDEETYYAPTQEMADFLEKGQPDDQLIEVTSLTDYATVNVLNNVEVANKELNNKAEELAKKITIDNYDDILTELSSFIPQLQLKHKIQGSEINFDVAQAVLENKYEELKNKVKPGHFMLDEFYEDVLTKTVYTTTKVKKNSVIFTNTNGTQTIEKQQNELWTMRKVNVDTYEGKVQPASEEVKENATSSKQTLNQQKIKEFLNNTETSNIESVDDIFNVNDIKQDC